MQKYSVNQQLIETVLATVKAGEIAIPEIQRPFVWGSSKVRDLMDSLYQGYPIGYLIAWKNPNVRLNDGRRVIKEVRKSEIDSKFYVLCASHNPQVDTEELPRSMICEVWKVMKILTNNGW